MKVSVVMSCYNSEDHVAEAIESILNQTFTDFEFIIWDDGSTDRTEQIIKSYNDERIRYFYHENTGLGTALKLACEKATGEYIARMDADDISMPNRLQRQIDFMESNPNTVLVSSGVNYIDDDGKDLGYCYPITSSKVLVKRLLRGQSCIYHPASMFRRDAYEKAGGYNGLKKAQDLLLFLRMSKYGDICMLPDSLLHYRISENSISSQTGGNSYYPLFTTFIRKMAKDDTVKDEDVALYNEIVALSKKENIKCVASVNQKRQSTKIDVKTGRVLEYIMGEKFAHKLIVSFKNLYGLIR